MTDRPILFVAGLGRCGTTMMMAMLDRGGFPCAGPRPAFEPPEMMPASLSKDWVRQQAGRAVKWIDPLHVRISRNDLPTAPIILHMDRAADQMARSSLKLLQWGGAPVVIDRRTVRHMSRSIKADKPRLSASLDHTGTVYHFTFEWVIASPFEAAAKLAAIIAREFPGMPFDPVAAGRSVIKRTPFCAPDMSIEMGMNYA